MLLLWERNVVSFLSDQQDQALNSPEIFYLLKGQGSPVPRLFYYKAMLLNGVLIKKKSHAFYPLKSGGCSIFQE